MGKVIIIFHLMMIMKFNRFYTTDLSRSRKTTGLGLTIAKNLTVKMGGSISASLNNNVFEIVVCFPKQKG